MLAKDTEGILLAMCREFPRQQQGFERGWEMEYTELHGNSEVSIFDPDGNRDDLANILKCHDSRHKRNFHPITIMKFRFSRGTHRLFPPKSTTLLH